MLPRPAVLLPWLACSCFAALSLFAQPGLVAAEPSATSPAEGRIAGTVKDSSSKAPLERARVVLRCDCLGSRETVTDQRGTYQFDELPPGDYAVEVFAGVGQVRKLFALPADASFRANFTVDPADERPVVVMVEAYPVAATTMPEPKRLPVGSNTSRDFEAVVELAAKSRRRGCRRRARRARD